jgi:hypothetical protein
MLLLVLHLPHHVRVVLLTTTIVPAVAFGDQCSVAGHRGVSDVNTGAKRDQDSDNGGDDGDDGDDVDGEGNEEDEDDDSDGDEDDDNNYSHEDVLLLWTPLLARVVVSVIARNLVATWNTNFCHDCIMRMIVRKLRWLCAGGCRLCRNEPEPHPQRTGDGADE